MSAGLTALEVVHLRLPLVEPWVTGHGTMAGRDVILVRVVVDGAEGWGECVALPEPTYSSEYAEAALSMIVDHLAPRLIARPDARADAVAGILAPVKGHRMAKSALETAVLDAQLRADGVNLADELHRRSRITAGEQRPHRVMGGVAVGVAGSPSALADEVGRRVAEGYRRVKLKISPGRDVDAVTAVRLDFPDLRLQVDANGTYARFSADERRTRLAALDPLNLLCLEQPLGDDDLVGHAALAAAITTPVCLDEAITGHDTLTTALALRACSVVNIKAGRVGGLLEAVRLHDSCVEGGVSAWCGGMLETGVGRAANLALASLPGFSLPGDLSSSDRFWAEDIITEPAVLGADGTLAVPSGPGSGVEIGDLRRHTATRLRLL